MTMVISGRRARAKAANRAKILDSALRLFSERGIDGVTIDEIAASADVGKGTIYNYFRTKEDIVVAFMADFEREVQARAGELDVLGRPLQETLTEFLRLQFRMKEPHHRFVRVFFGQMFLRTEQFLPYMAEIHKLTASATVALFDVLQKRGALRADLNVADLVMVFINIQLGLSALWAIEGPPFAGTMHALEREIAMFCEGIEVKS
jgi:AcrR family transcriptional regulator